MVQIYAHVLQKKIIEKIQGAHIISRMTENMCIYIIGLLYGTQEHIICIHKKIHFTE